MSFFRLLVALLAILIFSSCSAVRTADVAGSSMAGRKFREEAQSDVILRFASWNSIRIVKPDTTEDGFMPVYNFDEAERALAKSAVGRKLAVVVCGFAYKPADEAKQQSNWASVLGNLGFRRVTFVRLGKGERINGCVILNDVKLDAAVVTGG